MADVLQAAKKECADLTILMESIRNLQINFSVNTVIMSVIAIFCVVGDFVFPTLALVREMNPKGKLLVFAFAVPASFALGDHLGYVASVESSMVLPMIAAKLTAGRK